MIYICADDYGLCEASDAHIEECLKDGILNKISTFVNFGEGALKIPDTDKKIHISLHINLVEGYALSGKENLKLITDENGIFRYSFTGLLKKSLTHRKEFEREVYEEIRAQIREFKKLYPDADKISADGHQHTHMIPSVMKMLIKAFKDENVGIEYLRIPAELPAPFILTPSIYPTLRPANIIKQWLLIFLRALNGKVIAEEKVNTAYFLGVLFSGNMDKKRVEKILPQYIKKAEKKGKDIEVLFHPGYLNGKEDIADKKGIAFENFYFSEGRKTEYDTLMSMNI